MVYADGFDATELRRVKFIVGVDLENTLLFGLMIILFDGDLDAEVSSVEFSVPKSVTCPDGVDLMVLCLPFIVLVDVYESCPSSSPEAVNSERRDISRTRP